MWLARVTAYAANSNLMVSFVGYFVPAANWNGVDTYYYKAKAVGDSTSLLDTMEGTEDDDIDLDKPVSRDHSAHDYQSRLDLAAALVEMGRRHAAVRELLAGLESTLLCKDYLATLRCIAMARGAVNVPKVRDRICEILARHAPEE